MLNAGTKLGPYEIQSALGAGGMGEVYRARDTRLDRTVAIKVLSRAFAADAEFRERFDREARSISQLSHPHICTLHDVGDYEGTPFLVVEFIEGETLAARLERGRLSVQDALKIAIEVASALDAAHRAGIVHRDLKPGNVMLTRPARSGVSGPPVAKLLDFGLAKSTPVVRRGDAAFEHTAAPTTAATLTARGMILGTFQYMAPEQLEGEVAGARTDIFAFGCVLYEMLTGRKAFEGRSHVSLIAAIISSDPPPVSQVHQLAPPVLDRLVRTCLAKDPEDRWQTARDLQRELTWIAELTRSGAPGNAASTRPQPWAVRQAWLAWTLAALALAGLAAVIAVRQTPGSVQPASLARVMITLPAGQALEKGRFSPLALSPDGRAVVYSAAVRGGQTQLYERAIDGLDARPIPATEGATAPIFSPDGRWLAFYADGSLKKVSLAGGVPLTIGETPPIWSASWQANTIVFATTLASTGLWTISADGGEPLQITTPKPGEAQHAYPQILPGGTHIFFSVLRDNAWRPALLNLTSREWRLLGGGRAVGEAAQYLPTGHIVYAQSGGLVATPFKPPDGDLTEPPIPLLERVETSRFGGAYFAIAPGAGSLVYLPANTTVTDRTLLRVDRDGRAAPLLDPRLGYEDPALSPDGKRVAATIASETGRDIWIIDVDRGQRVKFTSGGTSAFPVWSPDGARLAFQSTAPGPWNLYWKPIDGSSEARPLLSASTQAPGSWSNNGPSLLPGTLPTLSGANPQFPMSWTSEGSMLAFHERKPNGERDLWVVSPTGEPTPFLLTPFDERSPRFSPDGKWLAYVSNESGHDEVYVQPFPGPGRKWPISTDGGIDPVWSRDGRELFYRQGEQMMAVSIVRTPDFSADRPRRLFEIRFDGGDNGPNYDVAPDGKWFVMPRSERGPAPGELHLVLNWFNEVTSRTPAR